ncbi:MAG TPA: cyclic nucleotide-binding domain-containing protein [Bacteroidota bacterium]|nr:cyclic nucleotide-binding domain-containing protein [Bacteroidota bacterium]
MKTIDPAFLKHIPIFAGLSDAQYASLVRIMILRSLPAGSSIIREHEHGTEMFILLEGEVEVSKTLMLKVTGRGLDTRDKMLQRLSASDHAFFGEMGFFDEHGERSASVVALTPVDVAVITKEEFFALADSDKDLGYVILKNIIRIVSVRLDKTTKDVVKLTTALSLALER